MRLTGSRRQTYADAAFLSRDSLTSTAPKGTPRPHTSFQSPVAAEELPEIPRPLMSSSCSHLGQPTEVPTLAHAQVRGLPTSAGLSSAIPPPWPGTLPSAITAVPILSAQCSDRTGPNLPLPGSLTSGLLHPIQSHRAFSIGLQIQQRLSGQGTCHLRHETDSPLPGSL